MYATVASEVGTKRHAPTYKMVGTEQGMEEVHTSWFKTGLPAHRDTLRADVRADA